MGLSIPTSRRAVGRRAIRIGHEEAARSNVGSLTENCRPLRWYFAHASVGSNLIDGLRELNRAENFVCVRLAGETPALPPEMVPGTMYEHNRGNPGWRAKIDQFAAVVRSGWRFPKVDVVLNKLCYIDQLASAKYYLSSMSSLEESFPETIFVYATMPLTTSADWKSKLRESFNNQVREWTQANGRILFDIADIESHDSTGNPCAFQAGTKSIERLCPDYTDDGGHLNARGRRILANGFYALAAALSEINSVTRASNKSRAFTEAAPAETPSA